MSKIAGSITSTKRKTKSAPSAPRKRQRLDDTDGASGSRRSKNQQTLTQADWVISLPPSYDEGDMRYLDDGQIQTALPRKHRRSAQKPNSTLTQMDFFSFLPRDYQDIDDSMIGVVKGEDICCAVPQSDGNYDSPRKPRKREAAANTANPLMKQKSAPPDGDSQAEYKPSKRKRKIDFAADENAEASERRTSKRLASKNAVLSDPVKNFDYFAEALVNPTVDMEHNIADEGSDYPLEIKASAEDEPEIALDPASGSQCYVLPQTPKKNTTVILSSQSPESVCASTHRSHRKAPEAASKTDRPPLAERSTNLPAEASTTRTAGKRRSTLERHSPESKVVVLKLPKRNPHRRLTRAEDSQVNLWSIPSSSPELARNHVTTVRSHTTLCATPEDFEISATSQAQGSGSTSLMAGSQDDLPNLSQLFTSKSGDTKAEEAVGCAPQEYRGVIVRDFAGAPAPPPNPVAPCRDGHISSSPPFPAEIQDAKEPGDEYLEENREDVDFGSPIANDTQFNINIQHRVLSPTPPEHSVEQSEAGFFAVLPSVSLLVSRNGAGSGDEGRCSKPPDTDTIRSLESPPPVPRLVERSSADAEDETFEVHDDDDADEVPLPKPFFVHPSSIHRKTTQVPLNDTLHNSCSPHLSMTRLNTQRSVHPASMPHPSQVSTQDATQGFLLQSSFPQQPREDRLEGQSDKITIKDSSSSNIPLSQIPPHAGEGQSQLNGDIGSAQESASEDDLDLDLDPPSLPAQPRRPKLPVFQPRTEPITSSKSRSATTAMQTQDNDNPKYQPLESCSQPRNPQTDPDSTPVHASELSLPSSPDRPPPLQRQYSPIPGFNNETQSNFTQNGHVTAAYIHRQRESGILPKWFVPTPYQVPGYTRRN